MRMIAVLAILGAAGLAACGGDSVTSPSGSGRLSLMIKDSPYSDAKALLVTFEQGLKNTVDWYRTTVEPASSARPV